MLLNLLTKKMCQLQAHRGVGLYVCFTRQKRQFEERLRYLIRPLNPILLWLNHYCAEIGQWMCHSGSRSSPRDILREGVPIAVPQSAQAAIRAEVGARISSEVIRQVHYQLCLPMSRSSGEQTKVKMLTRRYIRQLGPSTWVVRQILIQQVGASEANATRETCRSVTGMLYANSEHWFSLDE
ncbi:MAG TPA: hypothetical protein VK821_19905, partial [Dehalococcoidia bacterium]|nr:hypothetical protein [Dehalococcoidia bacterium]